MTRGSEHRGAAPAGGDFPIGDELRGERATLGRTLLDVQRDLRIKAVYIAAIENADPSVFPNASFIPGYVRAYARYLGRDPEEVYARFRAETGFEGPKATGEARPETARGARARPAGAGAATFTPNFIQAEPKVRGFPALPFAALGSLVVLAGLAGGIGYAGWTVLQNVQRVQFAPVDELPAAVVAVTPPAAPEAPGAPAGPAVELGELARPVAATALAELYRRQELEVPILAPRDAPIAQIDPARTGLLADAGSGPGRSVARMVVGTARGEADLPQRAGAPAVPLEKAVAPEPGEVPPALTVVAERPAWIRVYLPNGTVIFERILETGETYAPPPDVEGPLIWAGNSGSVYVRLGDTLRGPLGSGTRAVRDVVLAPEAIVERYEEVAAVPDVIARAFAPEIEAAAVALQ